MNIKDLGRKLTLYRDRAGFTMEGLAAKSGVAENTILAIEKGRGNPTVGTLDALAKTIGIPVVSLFEADLQPLKTAVKIKRGLQPKTVPSVEDTFQLLSHYRGLPPERKALVAMFVFDDPSYLVEFPDFVHALEVYLRSSKLIK